jgi:hypothetical protein
VRFMKSNGGSCVELSDIVRCAAQLSVAVLPSQAKVACIKASHLTAALQYFFVLSFVRTTDKSIGSLITSKYVGIFNRTGSTGTRNGHD